MTTLSEEHLETLKSLLRESVGKPLNEETLKTLEDVVKSYGLKIATDKYLPNTVLLYRQEPSCFTPSPVPIQVATYLDANRNYYSSPRTETQNNFVHLAHSSSQSSTPGPRPSTVVGPAGRLRIQLADLIRQYGNQILTEEELRVFTGAFNNLMRYLGDEQSTATRYFYIANQRLVFDDKKVLDRCRQAQREGL